MSNIEGGGSLYEPEQSKPEEADSVIQERRPMPDELLDKLKYVAEDAAGRYGHAVTQENAALVRAQGYKQDAERSKAELKALLDYLRDTLPKYQYDRVLDAADAAEGEGSFK